MATAFNAAALRQRTDHETEAVAMRVELERAGMVFHQADLASYRAALRESGYYRDLRKKFTDRVWDLLERLTDHLT